MDSRPLVQRGNPVKSEGIGSRKRGTGILLLQTNEFPGLPCELLLKALGTALVTQTQIYF